MTQKYYLHDGNKQTGPFSAEELKDQRITGQTNVWYEGASDWVKAESVPELKAILSSAPPPFTAKPPAPSVPKQGETTKHDGYSKVGRIIQWTAGLALLAIAGFIGISYLQTRNYSGTDDSPVISITVYPPNPRVVTSRSDEAKESDLFDYAQAVDGTILNEGGEGNVLVTATLTQDGQTFTQSKELFKMANQSEDVHFTFKEANVLNGDMVYDLTAKAIN